MNVIAATPRVTPVLLALLLTEPAALAADAIAGRASVVDGDTIEEITGRAVVTDGDTITIGRTTVRLSGIDAPESRQRCRDAAGAEYRCGKAAADALDGFLAMSRPTRCDFVERDRYGRFVGDCYRADGKSVAAWLVRNGHALDWPKYSDGAYANEQARAKAAKAGMWRGEFEPPWDWRKTR